MKHTSLQVTPEFGCMCVRASTAPSVLVSGKPSGTAWFLAGAGSGFKALLRAGSVGKSE